MLDVVGPIHPLRTHSLRDKLVNEVHARPTMPLEAPQSASHLAVITGEQAAPEIHDHLVRGGGEDPFSEPPIEAVPCDWLATLPGEMLVALHVALINRPQGMSDTETALPVTRLFAQDSLIGSRLAGGIARQTRHAGQVTLTISSAHGEQRKARRAYVRIAGFFARLRGNRGAVGPGAALVPYPQRSAASVPAWPSADPASTP